jgi:O-acetyl-ADP-ribose deacetylase (regulator of RNase III)
MITYINKDVTTITSGIIGHGVNCQGVMGKGIARAIRFTWPKVFSEYAMLVRQYADPTELLGMVQLVDVSAEPAGGEEKEPGTLIVANCFTQPSCGNNGVYAKRWAVAEAVDAVVEFAQKNNMPVYLPKIGCGLGGLIGTMILSTYSTQLRMRILMLISLCVIFNTKNTPL